MKVVPKFCKLPMQKVGGGAVICLRTDKHWTWWRHHKSLLVWWQGATKLSVLFCWSFVIHTMHMHFYLKDVINRKYRSRVHVGQNSFICVFGFVIWKQNKETKQLRLSTLRRTRHNGHRCRKNANWPERNWNFSYSSQQCQSQTHILSQLYEQVSHVPSCLSLGWASIKSLCFKYFLAPILFNPIDVPAFGNKDYNQNAWQHCVAPYLAMMLMCIHMKIFDLWPFFVDQNGCQKLEKL